MTHIYIAWFKKKDAERASKYTYTFDNIKQAQKMANAWLECYGIITAAGVIEIVK